MFSVSVDEPVEGGQLVLNGRSADLMLNADGDYWAKWDGSDASGQIRVRYPDGGLATCQVGYVTPGMLEVQHYAVVDRNCQQITV
jgi:uncharacterized protein YfaP (DUF2135 family)